MNKKERRIKAEEYIKLAINSLNKEDDNEKLMIKELEDVKKRINNTIIYQLKC